MARIPQEQLVSARQNESPLQTGAFADMARANIDLLSSVEGAVQMTKKLFDQAQDLKNRSDIMEEQRKIRDAQGAFQNDMLQNNVPPARWGEEWKNRLKTLESGISSGEFSPVVKRTVSDIFKDFASQSYIQISGAALKEVRRQTQQNASRDYQFYVGNQQFDQARKVIEENTGSVFDEDQAQDLIRGVDQVESDTQASVEMQKDPITYKQGIDSREDWSTPRKMEEHRRADVEISRQASAEIDTIEVEISLGDITNEGELKAALDKSKFIDAKTKRLVMKSFKSAKPLSTNETIKLRDGFTDLVKLRTKPKEYELAYEKLRTQVLAYGNREGVGEFRQLLAREIPANYSEERLGQMSLQVKAKLLKEPLALANDLSREKASGWAAVKFLEAKVDGDGAEITNAAEKAEVEQRRVVIQKAFYDALEDEILKRGLDDPMGDKEMMDFLKKESANIIKKTIGGVMFNYGASPAEDANAIESARQTLSSFKDQVMGVFDNIPLGGAPGITESLEVE